jgi:predicted amidohydrolase YtcJ
VRPDLVLLNARIATMDAARPAAEALAIGDGRILALGTSAEMRGLGAARVIDAGGRRCLPGFVDAHIHFADGGFDRVASAALFEAVTAEDLIARLAAHAADSGLPLVQGTGWQPGLFGDHNLTARVLDRAVPDRPCLAYDSSFHNACLNSAALAMAGIGIETPDPPNGRIVRDAGGQPTGMLHEDAIPFFRARLPPVTDAQRAQGLRAALAHAARHGITGVLDPKVEDMHRRLYAQAAAEGWLTVRTAGAIWIGPDEAVEDAMQRVLDWRAEARGFRLHSAKLFLDGVIENGTAAMLAPAADTGLNAPVMFARGHLERLAAALDAARVQLHMHAIGDAAVRAGLDAVAAARTANGPWPALHQIAHVQMLDPADAPRFASLGAMANIQPFWARRDPVVPDDWLKAVGSAREPGVYAFRTLARHGARMCLSSDWPVSTLAPLEIIATAMSRAAPGGVPFHPAERLTLAEALLGYTAEAAAAAWMPEAGRLSPGLSADLVLLDRDPMTLAPDAIAATAVDLTLYRGRETHRAPHFDG